MWRYLYNRFIRPIFTINDTPHAVALGVSLGLFIAFTPTVGIQMILALVIGTCIKANRIIAVLLCWISNPITVIPMYYGYYWLGGKLLSIELWTFSNFSERMNWVVAAKERLGYLTTMKMLGAETLLPLLVGSLIIATLVSIPLYPLTLYSLLKHRRKNGFEEEGPPPEEQSCPSNPAGVEKAVEEINEPPPPSKAVDDVTMEPAPDPEEHHCLHPAKRDD